MAERVRGSVSVLVGVQPWRSVDIQFPPTEPPVAEVEKITSLAAALPNQNTPTSSEDSRVYCI